MTGVEGIELTHGFGDHSSTLKLNSHGKVNEFNLRNNIFLDKKEIYETK